MKPHAAHHHPLIAALHHWFQDNQIIMRQRRVIGASGFRQKPVNGFKTAIIHLQLQLVLAAFEIFDGVAAIDSDAS